ncbi:hypothetical protein KPL74_08845 [Bacillus sp. NP157]|nr:hypothetical protein KPL74_08845 [Bacillus sp. NP157]
MNIGLGVMLWLGLSSPVVVHPPAAATTAPASAAHSALDGASGARMDVDATAASARVTITQTPQVADKKGDDKPFSWNELIHDLSWPIAAIAIISLLHPAIKGLLGRVSDVGFGDLKASFAADKANEGFSRVVRTGFMGANDLDAVFDTIKSNEWATVVLARMLLRKGLLALGGADGSTSASTGLEQMIAKVAVDRNLPPLLVAELNRMRNATHYAEWWQGTPPKQGEWTWAVANARRVVGDLFNEQSMFGGNATVQVASAPAPGSTP